MDNVRVALNGEIKTPSSVYSGLPDTSGFIVLLGPKGRMAQILKKELNLLVEGFLDMGRSLSVGADELWCSGKPHQDFLLSLRTSLWSERTKSLADLKGP